MKRFNYLNGGNLARSRRLHTTLAIDDRIRGPLAALAATVAFTGAIAAVQLSRLHSAQDALAISAMRLAVSERNVATIRGLQQRLAVQTQLVKRLADIRNDGVTNIAHVAWVGNHLPHDTWLRTLRYENGTYSLDGTAGRVAAVGNAIIALHGDGRNAIPQLVSIQNDRDDRAAGIRYTLRLETRQ